MRSFNCPEDDLWQRRDAWLSEIHEKALVGVHDVSDHASALMADLHIAYCAGAWIAVVVLSVSIIDAHLRENEAMDNKIGTQKLLDEYYADGDINWLRLLRNKYVHLNLDRPFLTMSDWYDKAEQMELEATKAVEAVIKALYQNPGI